MQFDELKKQVESLNSTNHSANKPLSKVAREVHFFEQDLRLNGIFLDYSILLSDLEPEKANERFGPHNYTRRHYKLNWHKFEKSYFLTLTNVLANKSVKLRDCPPHLQQVVVPVIHKFIENMALEFQNTAQHD